MHKVFKYALPIEDCSEVQMPEGAQILKIDAQYNRPCIWALVNPDAPNKVRRFRFAGTGHPISENPDQLFFHGTFHLEGGALVFHVFEITS